MLIYSASRVNQIRLNTKKNIKFCIYPLDDFGTRLNYFTHTQYNVGKFKTKSHVDFTYSVVGGEFYV